MSATKTKDSQSHNSSQEEFLKLMLPKYLFGIPSVRTIHKSFFADSPFVFLQQKRERGPARHTRRASGRKNPPPALPCVFYCKLRLKSLAWSQAFHLGRCIPANTHEHYMFAYVSRVRAQKHLDRIYLYV